MHPVVHTASLLAATRLLTLVFLPPAPREFLPHLQYLVRELIGLIPILGTIAVVLGHAIKGISKSMLLWNDVPTENCICS